MKRLSQRLKRCWRRLAPPPPSGRELFAVLPVRDARHLQWCLRRKGWNFFVLQRGRHWLSLSLWWRPRGVTVCEELGNRWRFVSHAALPASPLGKAMRESKLYVCHTL